MIKYFIIEDLSLHYLQKNFHKLDMNRILYKNNKKILSDSTLVALTLLIAESKPHEKEIMINIVMNFLTW